MQSCFWNAGLFVAPLSSLPGSAGLSISRGETAWSRIFCTFVFLRLVFRWLEGWFSVSHQSCLLCSFVMQGLYKQYGHSISSLFWLITNGSGSGSPLFFAPPPPWKQNYLSSPSPPPPISLAFFKAPPPTRIHPLPPPHTHTHNPNKIWSVQKSMSKLKT